MDSGVTLWQFLLELLLSDRYQHLISWTSCDGEFKLLDAEAVAKLWGLRKNKTNMNYDKLSRALRYYYDKNIIKKVLGQKFVYRFVSFPDRARLQTKLPMKRKLSSMSSRAVAMELRTGSGRYGKGAHSNSSRSQNSSSSNSNNNNSIKGFSQSSISHDHAEGIGATGAVESKMPVMGIGVEQERELEQEQEQEDRIQVKRSRSASSTSSSCSSSYSSMDPSVPPQARSFNFLDDGMEKLGIGIGSSGVGLCGLVRDANITLPCALDNPRMDWIQLQPWLFSSPSSISSTCGSSASVSGSGSGSGVSVSPIIPTCIYSGSGGGKSPSSSSILMQERAHYFSHHFWLALTGRLPNFPITPGELASLVTSSTSSSPSSLSSSPTTFPSKKSPHYLLTSLLIPGSPPESTATTTISSASSVPLAQHLPHEPFLHFPHFNSIDSAGSTGSGSGNGSRSGSGSGSESGTGSGSSSGSSSHFALPTHNPCTLSSLYR